MEKKVKLIDSYWTFFVALMVVGPFCLPLLWRNPRLSRQVKILGTGVVLGVTAGLIWLSKEFGLELEQRFHELKKISQQN